MPEPVPDRRTAADPAAERQRAIVERLLLAALHEQDLAKVAALEAGGRARFLAAASRDLAQSLEESATQDAVARRTLPRGDSWCIVDIVDLDGAARRLTVAHPDDAMQARAQTFAETGGDGFGDVIVVPLAVRGSILGAITFVARAGDAPFSSDETALASDIADLCALALDNARLYRESERLRAVADGANRAKSTFLGNMSHELMTPLNAIGGYVTLLEMGLRGPVSAEQRIDLGRIRQSQTHLLTLISQLLTFVRSEGGRLEYRFAQVRVQSALEEVADMMQGAVDERQLTLVRVASTDESIVWADPDRLRQILLNLVMNAVKYAATRNGRITLTSTASNDMVAIHVIDEGPGIPEDKLELIFDPFVQLPTAERSRAGGVGLGLAISQDLARAMNGDLTVQSTVGSGSQFTLHLPRAPRV
jgi:signal transduction histidine kinase